MSEVIIGITKGRESLKGEEWYKRAIEEAGGTVVMLPPGEKIDEKGLNGLLLPGGGDVEPSLYGEENQGSESIDEERDKWEMELTRVFFQKNKPILGICRGAQVLNVALGGTLYQNIKGHREGRHLIRIEKGSLLSDILCGVEALEVNSSHHQAVKEVAPSLRAIAWSDDGVIEGVEGDGFILGIQFHPERMLEEQPIFNIFKQFVQASRREIYTIGTSKREWQEFLDILRSYSIEEVVDVRRFPVSKFDWFRKEQMEHMLKEGGISYIWMGEELGGYRSPDYETYTKTPAFAEGLRKLSQRALRKRVTIVCAEALPWRCHRRFIARALEEQGWNVIHIISKGKEWRPSGKEPPEGRLFNDEA